jgi:hypothetical protein
MIKDTIRDSIKKGSLKEVHIARPNIPDLRLRDFDDGMSSIVQAVRRDIPEIKFECNMSTETYFFTLPDNLSDEKKDRLIALFAESKTVTAWHEWTF